MKKATQYVREFVLDIIGSDVTERAVKTFVQAAIAVWLVADQPFSKTAVVAAVAAGVSAVWNYLRQRG